VQGKTVLITGGAKRVGAAICRRLHAAGANLMLHYRASGGEARLLQAELDHARPNSVALIQADLLDVAKLPSLVEQTLATFGRLDGLVNNASSFFATPLDEIETEDWEDLIGTNLRAPLFLAQAAAAGLRRTPSTRRRRRAWSASPARSPASSRPTSASTPSPRGRSCGPTTTSSTSSRASASSPTRRCGARERPTT
jgi:NAD(P)-dependent dehydrogenase (short-subunit alcohol dehydrogenase family)